MIEQKNISKTSFQLFENIVSLVEKTRSKAAIFLNTETSLLYYSIGRFIQDELKQKGEIIYGKQILVTLSQQLTERLGKGFSYSALTRMLKVANCFDEKNIATLSQQLSWSHFIELAGVENANKQQFYTQLAIHHQWNVRKLRTEQKPVGLLLCSEDNTEHIELLMLEENDIKVAQYLTELPSKEWFADKLHRALEIAKSQNPARNE